jgi:hypothetical protein
VRDFENTRREFRKFVETHRRPWVVYFYARYSIRHYKKSPCLFDKREREREREREKIASNEIKVSDFHNGIFHLHNPSDQILRINSLLRHVIEGKINGGIEVTGRRGKRRRKLLDDRKEGRGYSHLKEEALDRTM